MNCPYCEGQLDVSKAVELKGQMWLAHECPEKGLTKFIVGHRPLKGV